jgi:GMP synthase (glutamine-hydrolysing)
MAETLRAEGILHTYLDAWEADTWPDVRTFAGVVVLGGEMSADQFGEHPWLERVRGLVEDALAHDVPLLGICLGAQTLARALGAEVRRSPVKEVGFCRVEATREGRADPVTAPFAHDIRLFQWHEDAFELPKEATLLYRGAAIAHQAFRAGSAYGVQFHFEVDETVIAEWCDETGPAVLREEWGVTKESLLEDAHGHLPAQKQAAAEATRAFLRLLRR